MVERSRERGMKKEREREKRCLVGHTFQTWDG